MSIANEISRIKSAKEEIRTSIEIRGASIEENLTIDFYPKILESMPYAVKGEFTPEEDTQLFSIKGLPFTPEYIYVGCNDLYLSGVENSVILYSHGKSCRGVFLGYDGENKTSNIISPTSSMAVWGDNGYSFDTSVTSYCFKAGYTYEYIIAGGFS